MNGVDDRIVAAARDLLERGYDAVTVDNLAAASGCPREVVRGRFPARRRLMAEVLCSFLPLHATPATDSMFTRLERWVVDIDHITRAGGVALLQLLAAGADDELVARTTNELLFRPLRDELHHIIGTRCAPADVDALFATVWGSTLLRSLVHEIPPAPLVHLVELAQRTVVGDALAVPR